MFSSTSRRRLPVPPRPLAGCARPCRSGLERYTAATPSSQESQVIAAATSALLTFYRGRVHVIVVPTKSREEQDEIDIGGCRAGRGLRRERGAGARLSVASDHDDRAVSGWGAERYARSDPC